MIEEPTMEDTCKTMSVPKAGGTILALAAMHPTPPPDEETCQSLGSDALFAFRFRLWIG